MHEISYKEKTWIFSDADYEAIAEHVRVEDSKAQFLAAIEKYGTENKEFSNIEEFLKSHIDQAAGRFYNKHFGLRYGGSFNIVPRCILVCHHT